MKLIPYAIIIVLAFIVAGLLFDRERRTEANEQAQRVMDEMARTAARVQMENDSLRAAQSIKIALADTAHANRLNADHHAQAALSSASFDSLKLVFLTGAVEAAPE